MRKEWTLSVGTLINAVGTTALVISLIVLLGMLYMVSERKKKKNLKREFKSFSDSYDLPETDLRAVPRITIPESLEVTLTIRNGKYPILKAYVSDMSLSGFSVRPDFPSKQLSPHSIIENAEVNSPVNNFKIKELKTVRIERNMGRRQAAFHIKSIECDQFDELKKFITYLDEFLKNGD